MGLKAAARITALAAASLAAACAQSGGASGRIHRSPVPPAQRVAHSDWLETAAAAEQRGAWPEVAYALDSWARFHGPDESWHRRRLRAAQELGDSEAAIRVRAQLLSWHPADPGLAQEQVQDLRGLGRAGEAARVLENLAGVPGTAERAALLLSASTLHEQAGDYGAALRTLEAALDLQRLRAEDRAALNRLKAFQDGAPGTAADALALLERHPNPDFRLEGLLYLCNGAYAETEAACSRALQDPDPRVARLAARQLAEFGTAPAIQTLAAYTVHPDWELRVAALRGLGRAGSLEHVPAVLAALDPQDRDGFRAARAALESITGRRFGDELDPDPEQRAALAEEWRSWWAAQPAAAAAPAPPSPTPSLTPTP